jgi:dihydroxy-acid dehydratase
VGGPLAVVQSGDRIVLDVDARRLELLVSADELQRRLGLWRPPAPEYERGYYHLFREHVMQADRGVDFDFLVGKSGAAVPRDSH